MILARSAVGYGGKKEFGWAAAGFLLVGAMSAVMGYVQTRTADDRWSSSDQSLDSLDVLPLANRSGSIAMPGANGKSKNADWTNPESMLYQAPGGSQVEGAAAAGGAADKLSEDMGRASAMGKKPADTTGWNGEAPRTGLVDGAAGTAASRPSLAPMNGGLGGSNSGSSGSNLFAGSTPFGVGKSQPGEAHLGGLPATDHAVGRGGNQSLLALRQVAQAMGNARTSHDLERSWGHGAGSFDGASAASGLSGGGGADGGIGMGSGVPANLKSDVNSNDLAKKDIQPPAPAASAPVDNSSIQNRELMMMAAGLLAAGLVAVMVNKLMNGNTTASAGKPPTVDNGCIDPSTCRPPTSGKG